MIAPPEKTMEDGIVNKMNEDSILTSIDDENVDNYLTLEKELNESKKQRIMIDESMEEKSAGVFKLHSYGDKCYYDKQC